MPNRKNSSGKSVPQTSMRKQLGKDARIYALIGVLSIVVLVNLTYYPSLSDVFLLDDDRLMTNNDIITAPDGLYRFWFTAEATDYWPVTFSTFWIEWRIWGAHLRGSHVTNMFLHIVESLLIWIILRKLAIPGAFLAAVIFAVHPVNVESVAWISQRKNLMAMLFFLLSILWYLKSETKTPGTSAGVKLAYWFSLTAFIFAMLSKGSVAVLPLIVLGIVWWIRPLTTRDFLRTAPYFVIAVVLAVVNVWFQTHGKEVTFRDAGTLERLLGAASVVWFYLYKAILPLDLVFIYPLWHVRTDNVLWWLPLAAVVFVTATLWLYRTSWSRPLLFAWSFFCVSLLPAMGFTDVGFMRYSLVADHYQHIAIIGVIAIASATWTVSCSCFTGKSRHAAGAITFMTVAILSLLTWRQAGLYRDPVILYEATLEKNPSCWLIHNNLGNRFLYAERFTDAINHYRKSLMFNAVYQEAHYNLANVLLKTGNIQEAIEHYNQVLLQEPNDVDVHYNLGGALLQSGNIPEAIIHCEKAIRLNPSFTPAYTNLALAYAADGQSSKAIVTARKALALACSKKETALIAKIEDWLNANSLNKDNINTNVQLPP